MNEINIPEELLKSKIVVVDFFATWCGPCKALSPIIDELTEEYKNDSDVTFIKIDVDNNIELAKTLNVKAFLMLFLLKIIY
jgi:thioredoxin 1